MKEGPLWTSPRDSEHTPFTLLSNFGKDTSFLSSRFSAINGASAALPFPRVPENVPSPGPFYPDGGGGEERPLGFVAGQKGSGERGRAVHLLILGDNGHVPSERVHQVLDG